MLLKIKFFDQSDAKPFKGGAHHTKKFERLLKKTLTKWHWATIYGHGPHSPILHYYHNSMGLNQLNKKQFLQALNSEQINLYIVYTPDEKKRRGSESGQSIPNKSLEAMASYYTKGVSKVMAYQNNELIQTYPS